MNTARTIEQALKEVCNEFLAMEPALWIRTSRVQDKMLDNNGVDGGEAFPQLFISAYTKYYTNVYATYAIDVDFSIYTDSATDEDGTQLSDIEEALEGVLDALSVIGSAVNLRFTDLVQEHIPSFNFGAFYAESSMGAPSYNEEYRTLSQVLTLHYSV